MQKLNKMNILKSTREYKLIKSAGGSGYVYDGYWKGEKGREELIRGETEIEEEMEEDE